MGANHSNASTRRILLQFGIVARAGESKSNYRAVVDAQTLRPISIVIDIDERSQEQIDSMAAIYIVVRTLRQAYEGIPIRTEDMSSRISRASMVSNFGVFRDPASNTFKAAAKGKDIVLVLTDTQRVIEAMLVLVTQQSFGPQSLGGSIKTATINDHLRVAVSPSWTSSDVILTQPPRTRVAEPPAPVTTVESPPSPSLIKQSGINASGAASAIGSIVSAMTAGGSDDKEGMAGKVMSLFQNPGVLGMLKNLPLSS